MEQLFDNWQKVVDDNKAGKNICFVSRGEWSDPEVAYRGILLNYWDVYDMCEKEEPTDEDWHCAAMDSFDAYMESAECGSINIDEFKISDVTNVNRVIDL